MSIELNNNTIIRMLIRRGPDSDRQLSTLAQGELGYTTDTQRLFIGNGLIGTETVAGNKFVGFTYDIDLYNTAFEGDLIFSTALGQLYTWGGSGTWMSVSPTLAGSLEYNNGLRIATTFAGRGLTLPYATGVIGFNSSYLTALSTGTSGLFIGNYSTPSVADSILYTNGAVTIYNTLYNSLSPTVSGRLVLSAMSTGTGIISGGSALSAITDSTNGKKTFAIKNGGPSSLTFQELTADPSFEFTGGLVRMNSGLVVAGSILCESLCATNMVTALSSVTSFTIDTTASTDANPLTALLVQDDSAEANHVLIDVKGGTGGVGRTLFNARVPLGVPYVGFHTTQRYDSSCYTAISGGIFFKDGPLIVDARVISLTGHTSLSGNMTLLGDLSATGDIIGFYTSDSRLKDNLQAIDGALEKTLALRGVTFDWNSKARYTGADVGLIAQDVQKQLPLAVATRDDGYLAVYYQKIIPLLVESIRELNAKVDALSNK